MKELDWPWAEIIDRVRDPAKDLVVDEVGGRAWTWVETIVWSQISLLGLIQVTDAIDSYTDIGYT